MMASPEMSDELAGVMNIQITKVRVFVKDNL